MRDRRVAAVVGRHARLDLVVGCRGGRTVLTHAYAEPPFHIGRVFEIGGAAYVIVVCAGPGVFAGDCLHQRVTVEGGARVLLASQSALQVHRTDSLDAAQVHHEYHVEEGGELHCHWDPVIPFAGARLVERFDLQVARGGRLYWSDTLMSGRASRGEAWQCAAIDHELRLTIDGALKYLERYRLAPTERKLLEPWMAGEAHYVGTTLVHHPRATSETAAELQGRLEEIEGVRVGIDLVDRALLVGRLLATTGVSCARARTVCREVILDAVFGRPELVARR